MKSAFKFKTILILILMIPLVSNCIKPICCVMPDPVYVELELPEESKTHFYGKAKHLGENPNLICRVARVQSKNEVYLQIDERAGQLSKYIAEEDGLSNKSEEFIITVSEALKESVLDSMFISLEEFIQPVGDDFECSVITEFDKSSYFDLFISNIEVHQEAIDGVNMDIFKQRVQEIFLMS